MGGKGREGGRGRKGRKRGGREGGRLRHGFWGMEAPEKDNELAKLITNKNCSCNTLRHTCTESKQ